MESLCKLEKPNDYLPLGSDPMEEGLTIRDGYDGKTLFVGDITETMREKE